MADSSAGSSEESVEGGVSGSSGYSDREGDNDDGDSSWLVKDEDVQGAIDALSKYVTPTRIDKFQAVLSNRTQHATLVFENPANPNNVWACIRWVGLH